MLQSSVGCAGFSLQEEITLYYVIEVTVHTQSTLLKLIQFGHLCIMKNLISTVQGIYTKRERIVSDF